MPDDQTAGQCGRAVLRDTIRSCADDWYNIRALYGPGIACMRMIRLVAALAWLAPGPLFAVSVSIDTAQDRRSIDPRIYGVNFGAVAQLDDPGYTVRRWGGNSTTRYNWQADVHNTAGDWFFMNIANGDGANLPDDSTANRFIAETLAAGAAPIVTVPTIGWLPLAIREKRWGFSVGRYGAQIGTECSATGGAFWCAADAGNGFCSGGPNCSGGRIVGNDPADTSFASDADDAQAWVVHLRARHGAAAAGGVRMYALDNEPMLWNSTHRDVHPAPVTYDEIWQKTVDYASAIKAEEPDAEVMGPVTWGYCDLFGSAADNCLDGADREAHGDVPFVQWYLRQVCAHQAATGVRLVDWLDLHYYPQGENIVDFGGNLAVSESAEVSARRLRSVKELYDPAHVSESWLADLGDFDANHYDKPQLLRRVRAWIDAECPGTKLAITEYNWGPDHGVSAALAQAEVLAIFGREGVDLATRWVAPEAGSKVEHAFDLFLDYDGAGSRLVGDSVRATSADVDALATYAIDDTATGRLMLLLINKSTSVVSAELSFAADVAGSWTLYRLDATTDTAAVDSGQQSGTALTLASLPARSANLVVISGAGTRIFHGGFEGR